VTGKAGAGEVVSCFFLRERVGLYRGGGFAVGEGRRENDSVLDSLLVLGLL